MIATKLREATAEDGNVISTRNFSDINPKYYAEYGEVPNKHVVFYEGIDLYQVLASALGKYSLNHPQMEDRISGTKRQLWDGGYLSNTPLKEVIIAHRSYWLDRLNSKPEVLAGDKNALNHKNEILSIPNLEIFIINYMILFQRIFLGVEIL